MDMTIRKMEEVPTVEGKDPQIVMEEVPATASILNMIWPTIDPYVSALADKSLGEYNKFHVYNDVRTGNAVLYMAYVVDDKEAYDKGAKSNREFAGYVVFKYLPDMTVFIWQAQVVPKYQGTNVVNIGLKYLEDTLFRMIGVKRITMSTIKAGWHHKASELGFEEQFTTYRKSLKE